MAENVNIVSVANGAFKEAYNGLPPWATQKTAASIETILKDILGSNKSSLQAIKKLVEKMKSDGSSSGGGSYKGIDDLSDELKAVAKESSEKRDKDKKEHKEELKELEDFKESLKYVATTAYAGFSKLRSMLSSSIDSFADLNRAGVAVESGYSGLSSGFKVLTQIASTTGVRIAELSEILKTYSTAVNAVTMAKFSKAIKNSSSALNDLGYTNKQAAELLGVYLETERLRGEQGTRDSNRLQKQLITFGKNISDLSLVTGMSVDQLLDNLKSQSASADSAVNTVRLGEEAARQLNQFIAGFKNQQVGKQVSSLITASYKELDKTYQALQKAGAGEIAANFARFSESLKGLSPEEAQQKLKEWVDKNRAAIDKKIDEAAKLAENGVAGAAETVEFLSGLKEQAASVKKMTAEELKQQRESASAIASLNSAYENLKAQLSTLFFPINGLIKGLAIAVNVIAFFVKVVNKILSPFSSLIEFIEYLTGTELPKWAHSLADFFNFGNIVGNVLMVFGGLAGAGLALAGAFKAVTLVIGLFSTKLSGTLATVASSVLGKVLGKAKDIPGVGKVLSKGGELLDKLPGRKQAEKLNVPSGPGGSAPNIKSNGGLGKLLGEVGSGIGSIVGKLGKGAGVAIQGIMTGLARGLAVFGALGPIVIKGALFFGGAMIILAGAMRISSFILGDTLPKLAEGLSAIGEIDGTNLIKVGVGLVGLASGMLAFSTSMMMSGAMGVLTSISNGIASFFGAKSPINNIKSLAENLEPLNNIDGENLSAVGTGLEDLSAGLSAFSSAALKTNVDGLFSGISAGFSKLIGVQSPLDNLKDLIDAAPQLSSLSTSLTGIASAINMIADSINRLDGLQTVIDAINNLDLSKAIALGVISLATAKSAESSSKAAPPATTSTETKTTEPTKVSTESTTTTPSTTEKPTTNGSVSVEKPPTASRIESKEGEAKSKPEEQNTSQPQPQATAEAEATKQQTNADINNLLDFQNATLAQLLENAENLLSVNKDMLTFMKNH